MSLTAKQLRAIIRELIQQELDEATVTGDIDGGAGPPKTPHAFTKKKKKKKAGYSGGHKNPEILRLTLAKDPKLRKENKYTDYRNDGGFTPKQKIGLSIRNVRNTLLELEKEIRFATKLKFETNTASSDYWKNTHKAMAKIDEKMKKISQRMKDLL